MQQNHLVNIDSIRSLEQLVWLDLQNNSLTDIAGMFSNLYHVFDLSCRFNWLDEFKVGVSSWQQYPSMYDSDVCLFTIAMTTELHTFGQ